MKILLFMGTADLLLTALTLFYYAKVFRVCRQHWFVMLYVLLSVSIVGVRFLPENCPGWLDQGLAYVTGCWLAVLFYSLLVSVLHFILWLGAVFLKKRVPVYADIVLLSGAFVLGLWGAWQAARPVIRYETVTTDKLSAGRSLRLALVSDVHLGRTLQLGHAKKVVELLNSCEPDAVVIAGDLLDERQCYVDKSGALQVFRELKNRYGTFVIFGNHDYFDRPQLWRQKIESCGMTVLENENCTLTEGVSLTGLKDYSRDRSCGELQKLANFAEGYKIVADHQPRRLLQAADAGYDLYLAGHTHTGQMFPNRFLTERIYLLDYGKRNFGKMTGIVSSGIGFWGPPIRSLVGPEVVLIEIFGTKNKYYTNDR